MSDERAPSVADGLVDPVEPLIQSLPAETRLQLRQIIALQYQGPLPPPAMMEDYERIIPNGADRLMRLLEKQTDHRIAMEDRVVAAEISVVSRGQKIAASLSVIFGVIACILGYFGHDWLAGAIGVTTIIGLAVVFVLGREPGQAGDREADTEDVEDDHPKPKQSAPTQRSKKKKQK